MERLNYKLEFADNGVIITDDNSGGVNVYQEKEGSNYQEYTARAISESIADTVAHLLLDGTDKLETKSVYKIKIEIR